MSSSVVEIKKEFDLRSGRVKSVDFHPTEPWVLLGSYSGTVSIWNHSSREIEKSFKITESPVRTAKFVPNKPWIVAGSDDKWIRVYDYEASEKVKEFEGHADFIRSVTVHPTLPCVLSASDDMLIKLWDWTKDWECIQVFQGHGHYVMDVSLHPKDPNSFASASLDGTVKVWKLDSPDSILTLEGHSAGVNCVEFFSSGDKQYLISGSDDRTVKVWDYQVGNCVHTLEGHTHNVTAISVHPEFPLVTTCSEDSTVRAWNATTFRFENALGSEAGRVWAGEYMKATSRFVIGCDEGIVVGSVEFSST